MSPGRPETMAWDHGKYLFMCLESMWLRLDFGSAIECATLPAHVPPGRPPSLAAWL